MQQKMPGGKLPKPPRCVYLEVLEEGSLIMIYLGTSECSEQTQRKVRGTISRAEKANKVRNLRRFESRREENERCGCCTGSKNV